MLRDYIGATVGIQSTTPCYQQVSVGGLGFRLGDYGSWRAGDLGMRRFRKLRGLGMWGLGFRR